jgi:hypothetical protein
VGRMPASQAMPEATSEATPEATPAARKRRAATGERAPAKRIRQQVSSCVVSEVEKLLLGYEEKEAHRCADTSATSVWMALNVVLDHSTFEKSLLRHDLSTSMEHNHVPLVTRKYEESFMRKCAGEHEKPCSMGEYCECNFIDAEHAFVGVSFVMPELHTEESGMCILCMRKLTQMVFYHVLKAGYKCSHLIQSYALVKIKSSYEELADEPQRFDS